MTGNTTKPNKNEATLIDEETCIDTSSKTKPKHSVLTITNYGLFVLALFYTLYFAKSLLMPIVVALLFSLLLSPLVTMLKNFYIPRTISSALLLSILIGSVAMLSIQLTEPTQKWLAQLPQLSTKLLEEIDTLSLSMNPETSTEINTTPPPAKKKGFSFFGLFSDDAEPIIVEKKNSALSIRVMQGGIEKLISILSATPVIIAQFMTSIVLILFLLIFGPRLYENYLTIFPTERTNKLSLTLVAKLQKELSNYIVTVTIINTGLGAVTASVFWFMGVNDALLWGTLVALLNFAPYVGPLIALFILCLAGITQYGMELVSLIPTAVYFSINLLEAQFITPIVLGRHMRLNPLVLILWLLIWGWLWGVAGILMAVPLLVCIKLAAGQLNILTDWVKLIETKA